MTNKLKGFLHGPYALKMLDSSGQIIATSHDLTPRGRVITHFTSYCTA